MYYLMVIPVAFYRVDSNTIACESAFAEHLRAFLPKALRWGGRVVILSPVMSNDEYSKSKEHLGHIFCKEEKIDHIEAFSLDTGRFKYFLTSPFIIWPKIWKAVKGASVVHAGPSQDLLKPFEIIAIWFSNWQKIKNVFIKDIDHRASTQMLYTQNKITKKSYLISKYVYDRFVHFQMKYAVKNCSLLLLKGQSMVADYGNGQKHVKNFYDTAHDESHILSDEDLNTKLEEVNAHLKDIRLVYFGRVVEYKGIVDMISATQQIKKIIQNNDEFNVVTLTIIGSGDQKSELEEIVKQENIGKEIKFIDAIKYGPLLFSELGNYDFLLAAPSREDTPRSVFDSMACGLPILGYDTYYYKDLEKTGAVKTSPWLSVTCLVNLILETKRNTSQQKSMITSGVEFAENNTQQIWLEKRQSWQIEFLG